MQGTRGKQLPPLPPRYTTEYELLCSRIETLFNDTIEVMKSGDMEVISQLRRHCDEIKDTVSDTYHRVQDHMRDGDVASLTVLYVYVNILQESQEMVSSIRKYLRAFAKLRDSEFRSRPTPKAFTRRYRTGSIILELSRHKTFDKRQALLRRNTFQTQRLYWAKAIFSAIDYIGNNSLKTYRNSAVIQQ